MRIIIIANFTLQLNGERVGRFIDIAEMFSERGHDVELITTDFYHDTKSPRPTPYYDSYKTKITLCHEPGYERNVSVRRMLSHFVWGRNVLRYLRNVEKPDLIYCAVPSLTAAKLAAKYCRRNGVKYVTDVQDLWPEAFCMSIHNKLIQKMFLPMQQYANYIYSSADLAVAVSETYVKRTLKVNRKNVEGLSVYLGNNGALFESAIGKYKVGRTDNEILLCYVGGLKDSYDIPCVIDALALIKTKKQLLHEIRLILIGDGPFRARFEQYAKEKKVLCTFLGNRPYIEMASLLSSCDICINPIVKGSAASIINKVGDYAFAGLPVINTQECAEYRALIDEYQCGINCDCGCTEQVADALLLLAGNSSIRLEMGINSRRLARDKFDRRITYLRIIEAIENL